MKAGTLPNFLYQDKKGLKRPAVLLREVQKYEKCELTSNVVAEDTWSDNAPIRAEKILEILLSHVLWQPTDVQICAFYCFAARPGVRYLEGSKNAPLFMLTTSTCLWTLWNLRCTEGTVVKYKIVPRPSSNFKFLPLFSKRMNRHNN